MSGSPAGSLIITSSEKLQNLLMDCHAINFIFTINPNTITSPRVMIYFCYAKSLLLL